jgi:hypothetical protein
VGRRPVKATSKYDLMRGAILLGSCWVLAHIDISMAYHYIRGQAVFKLYVIFNLLEVLFFFFFFLSSNTF